MNEQLRSVFAALADQLIPAEDGMPSGGEVALERGALDAVLAVRPDVIEGLEAVLGAVTGADPAAEVERIKLEDPNSFDLLCTVVAGGYFMDPGVQGALGYEGQGPKPIIAEQPPDYERDGLLASVVERGTIYRSTPGRDQLS